MDASEKYGHVIKLVREKLTNDDNYINKRVRIFIHQTMCLSKVCWEGEAIFLWIYLLRFARLRSVSSVSETSENVYLFVFISWVVSFGRYLYVKVFLWWVRKILQKQISIRVNLNKIKKSNIYIYMSFECVSEAVVQRCSVKKLFLEIS